MLSQHIVIGNRVEFLCIGKLGRIAVINAVDIFGQQDDVRADLRRPQHRRGIRGEEGTADAAAEDNHPSLFQMPDGPGPDIGLSYLLNFQGGLHPHIHALLLQHVGHSHAVHSRGQHARVRSM